MKENAKSSLPGIPTLLGLLVLALGVAALFLNGAATSSLCPWWWPPCSASS